MKALRFRMLWPIVALLFAAGGNAARAQAPLEPSQMSPRTLFYVSWHGVPSAETRKANSLLALWDDADVIINMTGRPTDIVFSWFPDRGKVEEWKVDDPYGEDRAFYQKICGEIQARVGELAERLRGRQA